MSEIDVEFASEIGISNSDIAAFYETTGPAVSPLRNPPSSIGSSLQRPTVMVPTTASSPMTVNPSSRSWAQTLAPSSITGSAGWGAELTTWVTQESARGMGLGSRILTHLQARFEVLAGAGITKAALSLYLAAGFTFRAHLPRFLHVSDFAGARAFAEVSPQAEKLTRHRQSRAEKVSFSAVESPAEALAPLQAAFQPSAAMFSRDNANLRWRYDNHPVFTYRAWRICDAAQPGAGMAVILRDDRVRETGILHVVDMFGDMRHASAALAFIETRAQETAAFADVTATHAGLCGALRHRGWSSVVDDSFLQLPSLFYPVELRHPPSTSVCFWSRDRQAELYGFSDLHFSKGDLDIDRPTTAYLEAHDMRLENP